MLLVRGGPALLCSALRHGCRTAMTVATPPRHPEPADLVLAPRIETPEEAVEVAASASRALPRGGRLALLLKGGAVAAVRGVRRRLHAYGFARVRRRAAADGGVLLLCRYGSAR